VEEAVARPRRLHLRPQQRQRREGRQPQPRQSAEVVAVAGVVEAEAEPPMQRQPPRARPLPPVSQLWRNSPMM
jgi:hypothetical protein